MFLKYFIFNILEHLKSLHKLNISELYFQFAELSFHCYQKGMERKTSFENLKIFISLVLTKENNSP